MSSIQKTLQGESKVSVLLFHHTDLAVAGSLGNMMQLSAKNQIKRVLALRVDNENHSASLISEGKVTDINLKSAIASIERVKAVELISVCSSYLDDEGKRQLDEAAKEYFEELTISAPGGCFVRDHRLYFPTFREFGDPRALFRGEATSRLIIIPEDKQNDASFGKPMKGVDDQSYLWHIAIEVVSIAGLWVSIDGSVLEKVTQSSAGVSDMQVQIVRSFVRSASSPIRGFMEDHSAVSELPAPSGHIAAPDPYHLVNVGVEAIHGPDFQLRPQKHYDPDRISVDSSTLLARIFKRVLEDMRSLRQTLAKGYVSDVNNMINSFTQGVIGENSFLNCIPSPSLDRAKLVTKEEIQDAILELEKTSQTREEILWNGPSAWAEVIDYTLGVADGSEEASQIRIDAGNDRWVVLDKSVLVEPGGDSFDEVISALQNPESSDGTGRLGLLHTVSCRFREQSELARARCELLIEKLSNLKPDQQQNSMQGVSKVVSATFKIASFLLLLTLFVLPEWSHRLFDFHENYESIDKVRWFWFLSLIPAFSIALITAPSESKRRQNHMLGFVALYAFLGVLAWFVTLSGLHVVIAPLGICALISIALSFDKIKDLYQKIKPKRTESHEEADSEPTSEEDSTDNEAQNSQSGQQSDDIDKGASGNQEKENKWSERGKEIFKLIIPGYLMLILVLGLNDSNNLRRGVFEDPSGRFFWSSFLFSLAMFLAAFLIIDITRQREESRIAGWTSEYRWLINETKSEFNNYKIVRTFETQWYATAAVLARIFMLPYGMSNKSKGLPETTATSNVALMKFQATELELTEKGSKEFNELARWELNSPGWLKRLYGMMSRDYARKDLRSATEISNEDLVLPEECSYPVTIEEAINGSAKGRRWPFCYEVFEGKYDPIIRNSVENKLGTIMMKIFVENPESYNIRVEDGGLNLETVENLTDAFTKILPSEVSNWVPAVFGPSNTINHQVSDELAVTVWWPKAIEIPETHKESSKPFYMSENYSYADGVIVQAIRVDVSDVFLFEDFCMFGNSTEPPFGGLSDPDVSEDDSW